MKPERTKPFPWRCPTCGKKAVQPAEVPYSAEIKHDGRMYEVAVPKLRTGRCEACGELVFSADSDEQITRALRDKLRLLQPDQIRSRRASFKLTQKGLSERIGVAQETICRWESGLLIQSRANDNLMRLFFAFGDVRDALVKKDARLGLGPRTGQKGRRRSAL